jgi:hypothetical protein
MVSAPLPTLLVGQIRGMREPISPMCGPRSITSAVQPPVAAGTFPRRGPGRNPAATPRAQPVQFDQGGQGRKTEKNSCVLDA